MNGITLMAIILPLAVVMALLFVRGLKLGIKARWDW